MTGMLDSPTTRMVTYAVSRALEWTEPRPCPFTYLGMTCTEPEGHKSPHLLRQRVNA